MKYSRIFFELNSLLVVSYFKRRIQLVKEFGSPEPGEFIYSAHVLTVLTYYQNNTWSGVTRGIIQTITALVSLLHHSTCITKQDRNLLIDSLNASFPASTSPSPCARCKTWSLCHFATCQLSIIRQQYQSCLPVLLWIIQLHVFVVVVCEMCSLEEQSVVNIIVSQQRSVLLLLQTLKLPIIQGSKLSGFSRSSA